MRTNQPEVTGRKGNRGRLAALGLVLLPILCCGLPFLVAAGGLGLIGSVLRNPYVMGAGLLILLGLVAWAIHRRVTKPDKGCAEAREGSAE